MKLLWTVPAGAAGLAVLLLAAPAARGQDPSIVNTKHNLSVSGPGDFKAASESRICIFCHTPHGARSEAPLWNREDSRETYLVYQSTTFQGNTMQPTGGSKLCLSCHDGSLALGKVVSMTQEIQMATGRRYLDNGPAFIGTSLMDDHPVSFPYGTSRGGSGQEFIPEDSIPPPVHLDPDGFLQCTSCHDAHNNQHGDFLLATDQHATLCLACHNPTGWPTTPHSLSPATWDGSGSNPWPTARYTTVAENACMNCHTMHSAGLPSRLLNFSLEEENCLRCHSGHVAAKDINAELSNPSAHDPVGTTGVHDPTEDPLTMLRHSECQDCHNPHAARAGSAPAPGVPGPLTGVSGIDTGGAVVPSISYGYELCYKCHADNHGTTTYVPRVIEQANVRFEFDPQNPSYHPVEAPGANPDVPSLLPPWTTASVVACTDCHQSDNSPDAGGSGPAGPHGSAFRPMLIANYRIEDNLPESPSAYALCYRCHSRNSILGDVSFRKHKKHIVDKKTACSVCHDAHGIDQSQGTAVNNTHLINFNSSVVTPNSQGVGPRFDDDGFRAGTCNLRCHGKDHKNKSYHP